MIFMLVMAVFVYAAILFYGFFRARMGSDRLSPRRSGYTVKAARDRRARPLNPFDNPAPVKSKAVPPFPFGPVADLIKEAEAEAERQHYELFPEDDPRPKIVNTPDGIINFSHAMSQSQTAEIKRRWAEKNAKHHGIERAVLLANDMSVKALASGVLTKNEIRERMGLDEIRHETAESLGMPPRHFWSRYIEGVGMISADSEDKLHRACEVAIEQEFRKHEAEMRSLDTELSGLLRLSESNPLRRLREPDVREARYSHWERCTFTLKQLQQLNQEMI